MELVIGTYSKVTEPGIHLYQWDATGSAFVGTTSITGIENPSYLDIDNALGLIYAITEKKDNVVAELHIYQVEAGGGQPTRLSCIPFPGAGSCFISSNSLKKHAFVTNYGDGTLTVIKLPQKNHAGGIVQHLQFNGSGPNEKRQDRPHLHAALLSGDERYLYCSDLGSDRFYRFTYQPEAALPLQPDEPPYLKLPPGSGPRHFAFSPDGRWLYLITELSGEVFVFDADGFAAGWQQRVSLVQDGYFGKIEAADIQVHPNGRYLYASNRGDANEIVVFSIEPENGRLTFLQRIGAAGLSPRCLLICEEQGLLLAANEQSDNVSIFKLHSDGTLEFTREHLEVSCPTCLKSIRENRLTA
ncbi:MAG TPA: lactonase family protein [Pedobacter sp.]|jgi:6-phosphogluconolactonase